MTEHQLHSIDLLNELYAAERRSLLPRLAEMGNYVSHARPGELELIRCMVAEHDDHLTWLIEAIERCGGGVLPGRADAATASMHYIDLATVMPRVIADLENTVKLYEAAAAAGDSLVPEAVSVIDRIHQRHREQLQQLRGATARH